jgi:phosphatidyl-myo-inositol alpha-mannosyltransferase
MKIALVSAYDFAVPGGVVDHIRHLAAQFQRMGHTVHIMAPWSRGAAPADLLVHRFGTVVPIPANGSVARLTLAAGVSRRVKAILRAEQFDVVHIHEPLLPVLPLTVLRHSETVTVGTFHAYRQSNLGYVYARPLLSPFFRRLHGQIAVSAPVLEFMGQYFDAEYEIIPNGIDIHRFDDSVRPLPELADGRPTILFVGRYNEPRKGFKYLLKAMAEVRRAVPGVRLVVVGRGKPDRYRRYLAARGVEDVHFAGCVSHEELPRYYASCDVFCAPSTGRESFGIVLLEAMASRRPVVASRILGYSGVVTDGAEGLLVPPKEPEALVAALVRLLRDPDRRRQMGARGRTTAEGYAWEKVSRRVLRYYREVAVPRRRLMRGVR